MVTHYIGPDGHSNNTELGIERNGKIAEPHALSTTMRAIRQMPRCVT